MVHVAVILLTLCSLLFNCVHSQTVNTTYIPTTQEDSIVTELKASGSDYWTEWYDVDEPESGTGDYETVDSITSKLGRNICPGTHSITNAECRNDNGDDGNDILKVPCSIRGLMCRNSDQVSGICDNYSVRFYCSLKEGSTGSQSRAPRFDMRIYIILAAVPVAIFILRICWSCTYERRRRRLRREARARRFLRRGESIDPEVFMPPPSYQELFGEGERPFSLSRHYSLCRKCKTSQCEIFRNRQSRRSETVSTSSSQSESDQNTSEAINVVASESTADNVAVSSAESPQPVQSESGSSSNSNSDVSSTSSENSEPQTELNSQTVEASQCDCPCHKRSLEVMAYDNPAYTPDVEIQDGRSRRLPGMHLSVFSLFRYPSSSSLTEPPPPSYREALKILEKTKKDNP